MTQLSGACTCGNVSFRAEGPPMFRAICHCSICQRFNDAAYGDILIWRASRVARDEGGTVDYKVHQKPPLLQRGKCADCGSPVLEKLNMPLMPKLMIVPTGRIAEQDTLPEPSFHMFYDCRVADAEDDLPKASGFLPSQLKFTAVLMRSLIRGAA